MRENGQLIMWSLQLHKEYQDKIAAKLCAYNDLTREAQEEEEKGLRLEEEHKDLLREKHLLELARPSRYIAMKAKCSSTTKNMISKTAKTWHAIRNKLEKL